MAAFRRGLLEFGWAEERNVQIHTRFGGSDRQRYQGYAAELVGLAPDVILGSNTPIVQALKQATQIIPVVFVSISDPVGSGLVPTLARPGGNITGLSGFEYSMSGKWLELLKEITPALARAAIVFNSATAPFASNYLRFGEDSARVYGVKITAIDFQDTTSLNRAIATFGRDPNSGLVILPDGSTTTHREAIINLAAHHRLPAVYPFRFFITSGGLAASAADLLDQYRRVAAYIDRVLRGTHPRELPVQVATRFNLLINLKTANALGLTVPPSLLVRADEVIE
jgi:putative ABC transport system substrate-binding protein